MANEVSEGRDPIGLELIVSLVSLALASVSILNQFGLLPEREGRAVREFRRLRSSILNANNDLDSLVLLFQRFTSTSNRDQPFGGRMSLSDTLMELQDQDYQRWNSIRENLNMVASDIADINSMLRSFEFEAGQSDFSLRDADLLHVFDDLFLSIGSVSVVEFVSTLRSALGSLTDRLDNLLAQYS